MDREVALRLHETRPDVVFNALHGVPGEDGTVQGMMDLIGVPYTHSGLATSVIAIDKELTKHALVPHGIPMPGGRIVRSEELYEGDPLARPYVLKPVNEGSSVGVAIVTAEGNYGNPISREAQGPWQQFEKLMCEPYIRGRELTAAVLGEPRADGHRAGAEERVLRFRRQVHRRDDRARLPGADSGRHHPAVPRICAAGAPAARLPRVQPVGLPLGRRARRGRAVPARDQHPAGHDPAQPRARAGAALRDRVRRAGRDHHRGRACATSASSRPRRRRADGADDPPQGHRGPPPGPRARHQAPGPPGEAEDQFADRLADAPAAVHRGPAAQALPVR